MKNMTIIHSKWQGKQTFSLIPVTLECAFQEAIFDTESKTLVVISKTPKQTYTMFPKVDDNGDPMMMKGGVTRRNGKQYKEEKRLIETYNEYYLEDAQDILNFIELFAINPLPINWHTKLRSYVEEPKVPEGNIAFAGNTLEQLEKSDG